MITQPVTNNPAIIAVLARWDPRINPRPNVEHLAYGTASQRKASGRLSRVNHLTGEEILALVKQHGGWIAASESLGCTRRTLVGRAKALGLGIGRGNKCGRTDAELLAAFDQAGSFNGAGRVLGRRGGGGDFHRRLQRLVAERGEAS